MWEDEFGEPSLAPAPAQPLLLAHEEKHNLSLQREGRLLSDNGAKSYFDDATGLEQARE